MNLIEAMTQWTPDKLITIPSENGSPKYFRVEKRVARGGDYHILCRTDGHPVNLICLEFLSRQDFSLDLPDTAHQWSLVLEVAISSASHIMAMAALRKLTRALYLGSTTQVKSIKGDDFWKDSPCSFVRGYKAVTVEQVLKHITPAYRYDPLYVAFDFGVAGNTNFLIYERVS